MGRLIYSAVITLLLPLLFLRLWSKGRQSPNYRKRWAERLGFFSAPENIANGICFHCVSVGETLAAVTLIKQVKAQYPDTPISITSTTPTGSDQVKAAFGDEVFHVYLPFDTPGAIKRFFNKVRPKLLVIMETELWPNLLHHANRFGCKTLLANARLSQKSQAGYQKIASLSRQMMANIALIAAHNEQDGQRFIELGLAQEKLQVTGSVKFDISLDDELKAKCQQLKQQWAANRPVWVVGSTHPGEDEQILTAFEQVLQNHPETLLILVPRHPERFIEVGELVKSRGFSLLKRSDGQNPDKNIQVILGDTMGELKLFWGISDIAFVGGSLVERGGHNPLEPALFSVAVLTGPHVTNFKQIYQMLESDEAVLITPDSATLAESVIHLIDNTQYRSELGGNALRVLEKNRGALARLQANINALLK